MILLVFFGIAGVPFLLTLSLQSRPGLSPANVALALVTHPIAAVIAAAIAKRITSANQWTTPCIGAVLTLFGIALVLQDLQSKGDEVTAMIFVLPLSLVSCDMGLMAYRCFRGHWRSLQRTSPGPLRDSYKLHGKLALTTAAASALCFAAAFCRHMELEEETQ